MERRGSGIKKMMDAYENDAKKPKFEVVDDIFAVTFYSRLYRKVGNNKENVAENKVNEFKKKYPELGRTSINIIEINAKDNRVTQQEIAKKLNKTRTSIYRNIKELKKLNIIERVGSDRKGYWKIKL